MSLIQDKHSTEWLRVKEYCETRLAALHEENEADLNEAETALVRGQIKLCREILGLADDETPVNIPNTADYLG